MPYFLPLWHSVPPLQRPSLLGTLSSSMILRDFLSPALPAEFLLISLFFNMKIIF